MSCLTYSSVSAFLLLCERLSGFSDMGPLRKTHPSYSQTKKLQVILPRIEYDWLPHQMTRGCGVLARVKLHVFLFYKVDPDISPLPTASLMFIFYILELKSLVKKNIAQKKFF